MPRLYLFFIVGLLLVLGSSYSSKAQQPGPTITGSFSNLRFEQFAQQVENQTTYRFYFNPSEVDSVVVNLQAASLPVPAALRQVFERSALRFAIDEATARVFITREYPLQTKLPETFFQAQPATPAANAAGAPVSLPTRAGREVAAGRSEFTVYEIGSRQATPASGRATITGLVRLASTGAPVPGGGRLH